MLFIAAEKRTLNLAEPACVSGSEHLICVIFDIALCKHVKDQSDAFEAGT